MSDLEDLDLARKAIDGGAATLLQLIDRRIARAIAGLTPRDLEEITRLRDLLDGVRGVERDLGRPLGDPASLQVLLQAVMELDARRAHERMRLAVPYRADRSPEPPAHLPDPCTCGHSRLHHTPAASPAGPCDVCGCNAYLPDPEPGLTHRACARCLHGWFEHANLAVSSSGARTAPCDHIDVDDGDKACQCPLYIDPDRIGEIMSDHEGHQFQLVRERGTGRLEIRRVELLGSTLCAHDVPLDEHCAMCPENDEARRA